MSAGVLKWHHPCFFGFFDLNRICADFQLHGEPFCLFQSGDIFFALHDDFYAFLPNGKCRSSRPVLASNADKHGKSNRTTGTWSRAVTRRAYLRCCKQRKHVVKGNYVCGLPDVCGSSNLSPKLVLRAFLTQTVTELHQSDNNYSCGIKAEWKEWDRRFLIFLRELNGIKKATELTT